MASSTLSITQVRNCPCGNPYKLVKTGTGIIKLVCENCGHSYTLNLIERGSRFMPFPKDVPRGDDIGKELGGYPIADWAGKELLFKNYETKDVPQYGTRYVLYCETEDGDEVKLATFSDVIAEQCQQLAERLPVIITPRLKDNYYTIF